MRARMLLLLHLRARVQSEPKARLRESWKKASVNGERCVCRKGES